MTVEEGIDQIGLFWVFKADVFGSRESLFVGEAI